MDENKKTTRQEEQEAMLYSQVIDAKGLKLKDIINKSGVRFVFCNDIIQGLYAEYLVINRDREFVGLKTGCICKFSDEDEIMSYDVVTIN